MRSACNAIAIVVGLLALLTHLLLESRSPDLALRARIHATLQTFELHDAELTRNVLLARAGLLANYDALAESDQHLTRDLAALQTESLTATDPNARALLSQRVEALSIATRDKLSVVSFFKSDNALLRNSLMYLTHAQAVLRAKLDTNKAVVEEMGHLSHSLLRFIQAPDAEVGREIQLVLTRLSQITPGDAEFQVIVTHGHFIVNILPQVDTLLRQTTNAPTPTQARALHDAVWQYSGRVEARAQVFRNLLYLTAIALLGYLIYQFLRLRASALQLRKTNTELNREMGERQQAERALRDSEERLRAITESAKEAIVTADSAGKVVSWNAGASAMFGYAPDEVLGTPFVQWLPKRHQAVHRQAFSQWVETGHAALLIGTIDFTGLRKDETEFPLEVSLSSWSTQDQHYVTGIMRDITERKRLEDTTRQQELQLIQANKMTALGTLVSGVAHEINNPNQLVLLNSRVLAEAWDDALGILDDYHDHNAQFTLGGLPYADMRPSIPTLVRDIHDGALRIERIVNDLKDFARPGGSGTQAVFHLNETVERALRLLGHLIRKRTAHFTVDLASNLPPLRGDAQQTEQVVVNLVVNALEALPDRDKGVTVSTVYDAKTQCAMLEVRDEGIGIAREHLARLCDPFFTTKQATGGTGLGLAITASLVRAHGARLDFSSELGKGTQAVVSFPHLEDDAAMPNAAVGS
jgi:PAS domain S-box-containing protein